MSTFAGLNGALTSLIAQRQALELAGQNIANVNTPGYTRQRASLEALPSTAPASMSAAPGTSVNGGVRVVSIARLGDVFLDTRVRQESSAAAYLGAVADAHSLLEAGIDEPGETGLASRIDTFFTSWQDLANRADDGAARAVLLENGAVLADRIATGYRAVETQWASARTQAAALVTEVNGVADTVADLNARIRSVVVSGGNPNELIDQRTTMLTTLAAQVGAEARVREDGTVDVMIMGNALVRGDVATHLELQGAFTLDALGSAPAADQGPVRLLWTTTGADVGATGGRLAGLLSVLGPATGPGTGGALAEMAESYNALATTLATTVNSLHATGASLDPAGDTAANADFFTLATGAGAPPAALGLSVALADGARIRAAAPGQGILDGSRADAISQLSDAAELWAQSVVDLGVRTRTATARAAGAETTRANAEGLLVAQGGVNLDEETTSLLAAQRAYEAAARVITTVDEMLDTLINRTGLVGR